MINEDERNSLTRGKSNIDKDKEINELDALNTFEIIQFESRRPKPSSKINYNTLLIIILFILLIIFATLYFLNKSNKIFKKDVKLFRWKKAKENKDEEKEIKKKKNQGISKKDDDEEENEKLLKELEICKNKSKIRNLRKNSIASNESSNAQNLHNSNKANMIKLIFIFNNSKDINNNSENSPFSDINTEEENSIVNCHFCDIKSGILFTYIFIGCSITISIINRVIFYQYEFEFNFFIINSFIFNLSYKNTN